MLEQSLYDRFYWLIFHFKTLQVAAILHHFFLFFDQSDPTMSSTYLDYLKYRYKSNKFSKIRQDFLPTFEKVDTSN